MRFLIMSADVTSRPEREELEEGIDSGVLARFGHGAQRSDHVEIFLAGEVRIEMCFLGDVAEAFAVGGEIFVNVLHVVSDFAVGGLKQAGEHFYRGAFSGTIWTQVAENLAGLEGEGYVLDGGNGAIEFVESFGCEHQAFLDASGQATAGVCGQLLDTGELGAVPIGVRDGVAEILNLQPYSGKCNPDQVKQVRNVIINYRLAGEADA